MLAEVSTNASHAFNNESTPMTIFGPIGALSVLWGEHPQAAWPGIGGQSIAVMLPVAFFFFRWRGTRPAGPPPLPALTSAAPAAE